MTQVTLKTIEQNDNVGMFSICFDGNSESEFEKFLMEFKDNATYNKDFNAILLALSKIIDKGALERFFRIEGRMSDHVSALSIDSRKLRLYCLRISDQILILGNGGVKLSRTYQENEKLSGYVMDLQTFDKVLLLYASSPSSCSSCSGFMDKIAPSAPPVTVSASDCLACCSSTIFSSMVSCAMSLYTCTGFF